MANEVYINGTDYSAYRINWDYSERYKNVISEIKIKFIKNLLSTVTPEIGDTLVVDYEGSTEFRGRIKETDNTEGNYVEVIGWNQLWDLQRQTVVSYGCNTRTWTNVTAQSIFEDLIYGRPIQDPPYDSGTATSGTNNTLIDTSKSWTTNEHIGHFVRITAGTGANQCREITTNTSTTLTVSINWGTNPDATSQYIITSPIYEVLGTTPTSITVTPSPSWNTDEHAGSIVRIATGAGAGDEYTVQSNTANKLDLTSTMTTPPIAGDAVWLKFEGGGLSYFIDTDLGLISMDFTARYENILDKLIALSNQTESFFRYDPSANQVKVTKKSNVTLRTDVGLRVGKP